MKTETKKDIKELTFKVATQVNGQSTRSVHAGVNRRKPKHALIDPIFHTSTFTFDNVSDIKDYLELKESGVKGERVDYGRYGNPTVRGVEVRIAELENAEDALLFASGMAALTTTLLTFLSTGDHLIITDDCYRQTRNFVLTLLKRFGVECTMVPMDDFEAIEAAIQPNTKLIVSETPTNPYLRVLDLSKLVSVVKPKGIMTIIDTTFASPINLRALGFGIDLVIHSATKYLGGHNDLLAGALAGRKELIDQVRENCGVLGGITDPNTAYLLGRGLKTLSVRVKQQNLSGQTMAEFLDSHPAVEEVWYPGLPSHKDYAIAKQHMTGFGGVVSFAIKGDLDTTAAFIDRLTIPYITPSLGGTESLVSQPALLSYHELTKKEREDIGIKDNLVRYALGIEDVEDIIADLSQALSTI